MNNHEIVEGPTEAQSPAAEDSPELLALLEKRPTVMHPVIRRHGRELFEFVEASGTAGYAMGQLQSAMQRAIVVLEGMNARRTASEIASVFNPAVGVLGQLFQKFSVSLREAKGFSEEQLFSCQKDIEQAAILAMAPSGEMQGGKSKIILPH